ncbi:LexA family protein [Streptomyces sp. NBC_01244]|uniref:LexA family protein n=1 Tax=Streptomyces sp. NBC_01244 TaxID=2903797 RepID=UPI002E142FB1|nr:hypothetical protein OG247_44005 [Streptomyces sp. NBC_01244]
MTPLKARRFQMLDEISRHIEEHGQGPSIRELGPAVGLSSSSSVAFQLTQLEQRGLLTRRTRDWSSVRLTTAAVRLLGAQEVAPRGVRRGGRTAYPANRQ